MRVEAILLLFLGVFFGIVGLVYWFWSYEATSSAADLKDQAQDARQTVTESRS
jgi:hypothetical protein